MFKMSLGSFFVTLRQVNPAVLVYAVVVFVVSLRRLFPKNKLFQQYLKLFLWVSFLAIMGNGILGAKASLVPNLFILRLDWFRNIWFGSLERSGIPVLLSIMLIVIGLAREYAASSFSLCVRSVMHLAAATGVLFAQDAMSTLFYLETVVIISVAIVMSDRSLKRQNALAYASLHVLSGVLMLVGMLAFIADAAASDSLLNPMWWVSPLCIGLSVAISVGVPPFGFLFVDVYGGINMRNAVVLASLLSKLTMYTYAPIVGNLPRYIFVISGLSLVPYVFVRLILQSSFKKIVLLGLLSHSATAMLFMSATDSYVDGLIKTYIGVSMATSFFIMSLVGFIGKYNVAILDDIRLLNEKNFKKRRMAWVSVFLLFILLAGLPLSVSYFAEASLLSSIRCPRSLHHAISITQMLAVFASSKIIFSFFGAFGRASKKKKEALMATSGGGEFLVQKNPARFSTVVLFVLLFALSFGGSYWYSDMMNLLQYDSGDKRPLELAALMHYSIVFIGGFLLSFLLRGTMNPKNFKISENYNIMSIGTELVLGVYSFFTDIALFVGDRLRAFLGEVGRFSKIIIRKSAVGEFAALYSSEVVICIAVLTLSLLSMLTI